jgi:hypothetical protein
MNIYDMIESEKAYFTISYAFAERVRDLLDAAKLVVQSEGTYDLEHLEECINNMEEEEL